MRKRTPVLTEDDLFTLRDACIHAQRANTEPNPDQFVLLTQKYVTLFNKLGEMIASRRKETR